MEYITSSGCVELSFEEKIVCQTKIEIKIPHNNNMLISISEAKDLVKQINKELKRLKKEINANR